MKFSVNFREIKKEGEVFNIGEEILVPAGSLEKGIRKVVSEENLKDTLEVLLVNVRDLLFEEIPELRIKKYIDVELKDSVDIDTITKLVENCKGVVYDFLDKVRVDTSNIFTPALLYEKLYVFINDSKIGLFKIKEMYEKLFKEVSLENSQGKGFMDVNFLGQSKEKSITVSGLIDYIYGKIKENRVLTMKSKYIKDIEKIIRIKEKGIFNSSDLSEIIKYFNLLYKDIENEVLFSKYRILKEREELKLYLEMNEKIGVYKDEEMIILSRESSSKGRFTNSIANITTFLNKETNLFYEENTVLNIYKNLNQGILENKIQLDHNITPFHWLFKAYEVLFYDVRLKYDGLRLTSKEVCKMVLDIKNHPFVLDKWDDIIFDYIAIKEDNVIDFISGSSIFKEIIQRAIDWFFDTYFFCTLFEDTGMVYNGSSLFSIPNKITLKNFVYIDKYKETLLAKDLYEKQKEMNGKESK